MIYLDNASTTKPSENAKKAFLEACENFGNPSSLHRLGLTAEKIIDRSASDIASLLGVEKKNIIFTSGGTEANNMAILGSSYANKKKGNHIITSKVEHPSVLAPFEELSKEGFIVSYVDVDENGVIDLEMLKELVTPNTILVSIMAVNNEVGAVMPIKDIKGIIKEKGSNALFHVDAVQGFGKIPLKPDILGIDMMSLSAHKIHGMKGTGALYIKDEHIKPLIVGGGQQRSLRSGTQNVPGIAAFGAAVREISLDNSEILKTRENFIKCLLNKIDNIKVNGEGDNQSGYILSVSFKKIKAEILLHMLEAKDIYVSTGSACSSNKPMPSHVLSAMGCDKENISGAIRFSFSHPIDIDEIERVTDIVRDSVLEIRKYIR